MIKKTQLKYEKVQKKIICIKLHYLLILILKVAFVTAQNKDSVALITKFPDILLGQPNLKQVVNTEQLAKGLCFYTIKRGEVSTQDFYTLSTGVISKAFENSIVVKLKELGYSYRIETPAELGPHGEVIGNLVRVGHYKDYKRARKVATELKKQGVLLAIRFTAEDGKPSSGPFDVSILEIDLKKFKGCLFSELGKGKIKDKENTSEIAERHDAIAAINAGFFAFNNEVGVDGDPAGVSIINGKLVSEPSNGRPAIIINTKKLKKTYIAHNVVHDMKLTVDDAVFVINGINRSPGKILNCGNKLEEGSNLPIHDFVCKNPNEIIVFNSEFGVTSDKGSGFEFVLDEYGKVILKSNQRGGTIPKKGYLVQAIGTSAKQLEKLIKINQSVSIAIKLLSNEGEIDIKKGIYAINGGPTLLHNGIFDKTARYREGFETEFNNMEMSDKFVDKKDNIAVTVENLNNRYAFYNGWVLRRHPRTAIGITVDDKIYIAVVYGRKPKVTAGASITEMTNLMQSFGCTEALNLDGGGSSMMIVNGVKTGFSSDKTGERAIGDAIIIKRK